ncbi:hypothetical protein P4597_27720 [Peribacillus simplex]|uniref:hypothetical protein n=1 Tax=Peribacillus simplex TaxID=1478 RepID=UPI002E1BFAF8|nr:hypothetical protein [Peribacillus simplex]
MINKEELLQFLNQKVERYERSGNVASNVGASTEWADGALDALKEIKEFLRRNI